MVFDMLLFSDLKTSAVTPQTAESLTSTDALAWTLKLRPNIKFTDGTPYDAAAVRFNWLRLADPKNAAQRGAQAQLISTMDVIDPVTLRIMLKAKNAVFPSAAALIPFIGSPTAIQSKGSAFATDPVGAGPFTLKQWVRDSQMVLVRNPNYWNAPRPYLDQVIVKPITDVSQRINTFNTTPNTMMYINTAVDADNLQKQGATANVATFNGGTLLYFNVRKPPFNDIRARQAITMAIDRAEIVKTLDAGLIGTMDSIFRKDSPFYDPTITQLPYDPVKAQQLFDQLAAETGGPLTVTLYSFNVNVYPLASQYVQAVLNKFRNVKVTIDLAATAAHLQRLANADFSLAMSAQVFDDPDPSWISTFSCASASQNTGFCDQKFDAALTDARGTLDANQRIADVKEAQRIFYSQIPAMYFEPRTNWVFTGPAIQDFQFANDGLELYDRLWIKTH
jgi:peptide/nickel transport system substrate-binding protein